MIADATAEATADAGGRPVGRTRNGNCDRAGCVGRGMRERGEPTGAVGCCVAAVSACVGLGVWLQGARPGLQGGFEDRRDWSLLYVELPSMLLGVPAITLAVCAVASGVLRRRAAARARTALAGGAAAVVLAGLTWACRVWLDLRVDDFLQGDR
ncbi:hypothetical protein ACIP98_13605 [Streptomyces sp. NPDC088354]|uniref:hypothetical protein n=1 Tax=unclassified Streptomyces TaxID=2593676 RepID=UPI0029AB1CA9|nr:hypothetical protein [Streptomyces sp. MI02-7b]MDX3071112.1 hypothetical protein [Streptomyces sp. MI02-7b]